MESHSAEDWESVEDVEHEHDGPAEWDHETLESLVFDDESDLDEESDLDDEDLGDDETDWDREPLERLVFDEESDLDDEAADDDGGLDEDEADWETGWDDDEHEGPEALLAEDDEEGEDPEDAFLLDAEDRFSEEEREEDDEDVHAELEDLSDDAFDEAEHADDFPLEDLDTGYESGDDALGEEADAWIEGQSRTVPRLFRGRFGQALLVRLPVPRDAMRLLSRSPTFVRVVKALDKRYVADTVASASIPNKATGSWQRADGVITAGRFRGRRQLYANVGDHGSTFERNPVERIILADVILIQVPKSSSARNNLGEWVRRIAHESFHAFDSFGSKAQTMSLARGVRRAIDEEIGTRRRVIKVLREIRRWGPSRRLLEGYSARICTDRAHVERNYFPSEHRMTYLEFLTLQTLISRAGSQLTHAEIKATDKAVAALKLAMQKSKEFENWSWILVRKNRARLKTAVSGGSKQRAAYAELIFDRRLISERWKRFERGRKKFGSGPRRRRWTREPRYRYNATTFLRGVKLTPPSRNPGCVEILF